VIIRLAMRRYRHISLVFRHCALLMPNMHSIVSALGVDQQRQSYEIPRDSAGVFKRALQNFAIVMSAVSGFDYCSDAVRVREQERDSPLMGV
jgi:hypothetical protein